MGEYDCACEKNIIIMPTFFLYSSFTHVQQKCHTNYVFKKKRYGTKIVQGQKIDFLQPQSSLAVIGGEF